MGSAVPMGVLAAIAVRRYAQESKIAKFVLEEDVRRDSAAPSSDPDELIEPLLEGNAEAWQQFVLSQHRRIYSMCYRFSGDAANAEDVTQEVFLKIYRDLKSYDPAKHNLTEWITTITRNLLVEVAQAKILRRAIEVIGSEAEAMRWMGTPVRALDYATPVSLLHNSKGFEAVRLVLGRLEHGIL